MMTYIVPVLIFAVIGLAAGALLVFCSKVFFVESDETVARITEALPGANCGACGYSGCEGYAAAVAKGEAEPNMCKPGGSDSAKKIASILGVGAKEAERMVAYVRCNGCNGATEERYIFKGTQSCAAAERFYNGRMTCRSGCDGLGDCVRACAFDAISIVDGVAVVDRAKCTGCGMCAKVCPNKLIEVIPAAQQYAVRCFNTDSGKIVREVCQNGCIGCKICEKKCSDGAIKVENDRAAIDPSKCTNCGECADACPRKCINTIGG
ncbi:MAG: RnfABCDGE type electron transport complex subunit B [Ruminococcaceae bacterium]|nr:RnfABCDGE type electron transport complex subunit B [Oscillospiraceae bacterium]